MLGLKLPTDPRWVDLAAISLEDILTDHAYCEQKAASQCISLIQKYPDKVRLVEELAPIVTEEWSHFRMVLDALKKRHLTLGFQRRDEYVRRLWPHVRKGEGREVKLLDQLLICALIEARSCERFRLLSENLDDPELCEFYRKFMVSEAGHYKLFIELAREYQSVEVVEKRWEEFLQIEGKIVEKLAPRGDRMH